MTPSSWLVLGCGYVGERLAIALRDQGARVVVTSRRPERAADLEARFRVEAVVVDPFEPGAIDRCLRPGSVIVDSIPPDRERGPHAGEVVRAAARMAARRIVYLSSTGVYGRGDGGWVDEGSDATGETPRGRARLDAERVLFATAAELDVSAVSLRIAAIYGPRRGVHERLLAGTYAVPGAGDNWVSRIHVDDLCAIVVAAASVEPLRRTVYVVGDDEPATSRAHADGIASMLGLPPPPSVDVDPSAPDLDLRMSNRRVVNTRLKRELGVVLRYPTWREGVKACLEEERARPPSTV